MVSCRSARVPRPTGVRGATPAFATTMSSPPSISAQALSAGSIAAASRRSSACTTTCGEPAARSAIASSCSAATRRASTASR